jgi:hypothetical protein
LFEVVFSVWQTGLVTVTGELGVHWDVCGIKMIHKEIISRNEW